MALTQKRVKGPERRLRFARSENSQTRRLLGQRAGGPRADRHVRRRGFAAPFVLLFHPSRGGLGSVLRLRRQLRGAAGRRRCSKARRERCRRFCCPARLAASGRSLRFGGAIRNRVVGGFCCPAPPSRWSPILLPGSARTLLKPYNHALWGISYAAIANASLSLAFVGFERFNGSFRPGKNTAVPHTSILVRPLRLSWRGDVVLRTQAPCEESWWSRRVLPPGPLYILARHHSSPSPAEASTANIGAAVRIGRVGEFSLGRP